MNLTVYKADVSSMVGQGLLPLLLEKLPSSLEARALRYKSDLSAYHYVVGRLLLEQGLNNSGSDADLEKIIYSENGKPILPNVHFNISHSHQLVICAFANEGELGVDLEKIESIDFTDFDSMFSAREWTIIKGVSDPIKLFYKYWTRKESIIKALGFKLSYLHQIGLDVSKDEIVLEGKKWYLRDLDFGHGYAGAVCSEHKIESCDLCNFEF